MMIGCTLMVTALLLARFTRFRHFYEILLLGLFLLLHAVVGRRITKKVYIYLYVVFFWAGIIADLIMGISITRFWKYNYSNLGDYLILYLVIYPFAGIVMVQTYIAIKTVILKIRDRRNTKPLLSLRQYRLLISGLALTFIGVTAAAMSHPNPWLYTAFYLLASILAFLLLSMVAQAHGHKTVIEDLHMHPLKILLVLFLATYVNAFLHELPNTYAREWSYTNYPLSHLHVLGIPLIMLLGWPVLLIVPVAAFYYIQPNFKPRNRNAFAKRRKLRIVN